MIHHHQQFYSQHLILPIICVYLSVCVCVWLYFTHTHTHKRRQPWFWGKNILISILRKQFGNGLLLLLFDPFISVVYLFICLCIHHHINKTNKKETETEKNCLSMVIEINDYNRTRFIGFHPSIHPSIICVQLYIIYIYGDQQHLFSFSCY